MISCKMHLFVSCYNLVLTQKCCQHSQHYKLYISKKYPWYHRHWTSVKHCHKMIGHKTYWCDISLVHWCIYMSSLLLPGIHTQHRLADLQLKCRDTMALTFTPGTWNNLQCHVTAYCQFCSKYSLNLLPLTPVTVIPFLQQCSESIMCYNTVANVFSSLKTWSKIKGHLHSELFLFNVRLFMCGLKRIMATQVTQMLPIIPSMLLHLYHLIDFNNSFHVCMWAVMLFLFFSFFRKSNVLPMYALQFDASKQVTHKDIRIYTVFKQRNGCFCSFVKKTYSTIKGNYLYLFWLFLVQSSVL